MLRQAAIAIVTVLTAAVGTAGAAPAPPGADAVTTISLPAPTGPYPVGVTDIQLTDSGRADPWDSARRRELMVQIWYPADPTASSAAWMPPGGRAAEAQYLTELGVPQGSWRLGPSHSHRDAPAATGGGRFPILLNSPGMDDTTGWSTAQAEELAGHGYLVVAINHTHEAFAVHFPGGRVEHSRVPLDSPPEVLRDLLLPTRVADVRFVLDRLAAIAAGDDAGRVLPPNLASRIDVSRVGMFGHSLGGSTTAQAMRDDPRIRAGVNLDGPILGPVAAEGLDRPLLLIASETSPWFGRPGWEPFWQANTGVKLPIRIMGTRHMSFCDQQVVLPRLAAAGLLAEDARTDAVGGLDSGRSLTLQRAYLRGYFDAVFGRTEGDLIDTLRQLAQPEVLPHP